MTDAAPSRWRRYVALLDRREDAASLAVTRIIAGTTVAAHLAEMWLRGVATAAWVDARHGGVNGVGASWLAPLGGATRGNVGAALWACVASAVLLATGTFTRAACVATWFLWDHLTRLNAGFANAADRLLVNILFVLMFSGCGRALSVDARLRGRGSDAPAWPRHVIVVQLVVMYFFSAVQKISAGWVPGGPLDALWYILQQPTWQRGSMRWLAPVYPLTQLATLVTWCYELAAPLLLLVLWYRATPERPGRLRRWANRVDLRAAYLAIGVALHVGIAATMDIGPFLPAVFALYACAIRPNEWRAIGRRVGARLRRDARARTPAA